MLFDLLALLVAGAMLYFGAEWLVRGAGAIAYSFGVAPLVIGLTVVSWGTSAPELVVSLMAATQGKSSIALGNVIGSNIANIGLILGLTALVAPPKTDGCMRYRELVVLLVATAAVPLMLLDDSLGHVDGLALLGAAVWFTIATVRWSRRRPAPPGYELDGIADKQKNRWLPVALVLTGGAVLVAGGHIFISAAVGIALSLGMSERVVGLTIVAIGTSLPELAASLVAALRGQSDLAIGNVIGSNVYNLLLILGGTATIHSIAGTLPLLRLDLYTLGALTVFAVWSLRRARTVSRVEGLLYLIGYVGFIVALAL